MAEYVYPFPKKSLSGLESSFLKQRLSSFDCFKDFKLDDNGKIVLFFERELNEEELAMLPNLLDMWLKPEVELNIDVDLRNSLPPYIKPQEVLEQAKERLLKTYAEKFERLGFSKDMLEWRESPRREGFHIRVKGVKFPPEKVLHYRMLLDDCFHRLREDRKKFAAGLDCAFLYDIKYGHKAGPWQKLTL